MPTPLRYILIGAHPHWCKVTLPRIEAVCQATCSGVVDSEVSRLEAAGEWLDLDSRRLYSDPVEAMQNCPADFAIIATPGDQHEQMVEMCLTFDLDMLIEPPLAETINECRRIYRRVRDVGKRLAVAQGMPFEQDKRTLLEAIKRRDAGRLNLLTLRLAQNFRTRHAWTAHRHSMQHPLLVEAGMQYFEFFRRAAGANAKSVFAHSWNTLVGEFKGDTTAIVTFEMENGARCMFEGSVVSAASTHPLGREHVRAECEKFTLDLADRRLGLHVGESLDHPRREELSLVDGDLFGQAWLAQQFCDWCAGLPVTPPTHLKEHMQTVAMTFAAIESAQTGKVVDVQPYLGFHLDAAKADIAKETRAKTAESEFDGSLPGELPV